MSARHDVPVRVHPDLPPGALGKPWWRSRTIWLALLTALAAGLAAVDPSLVAGYPRLAALLTAAAAAAQAALRVVTREPIARGR